MFKIIEKYINKLKIEDFNNMCIQNNLYLNEEELLFSYQFIKKNWEVYLNNPNSLNIDKYKSYYSEENFLKIKKLYATYFNKYSRYL